MATELELFLQGPQNKLTISYKRSLENRQEWRKNSSITEHYVTHERIELNKLELYNISNLSDVCLCPFRFVDGQDNYEEPGMRR